MTEAEISALLADTTKRIEGDIEWQVDKPSPHVAYFRASVLSEEIDVPLFVKVTYNRILRKTSMALFSQTDGRLFGIDVGKDHYNRKQGLVGDHRHRWRQGTRDRIADAFEVSAEIKEDPVKLWRLFCQEANIRHDGTLLPIPPQQTELGI